MYAIRDGYRERANPAYFQDLDRGIVHQPDVLPYAADLARERGIGRIVDVGCGHALKLAALRDEFEVVGVDYGANLRWCRENHDWGEWHEIDLDAPHELPGDGVIVCADVIEHLRHPEHLLASVKATGCIAVFSTPERELTWGADHNGPPPNRAHVREWTGPEFRTLLEDHFRVRTVGRTLTDDVGTGYKTILAVVE